MKLEIIETKKNPLLFRDEIKFNVIDANSTPKRSEITEKISAHTNTDKKNIVIKEIKTKYGSQQVKGTARIYESPEKMKKIELKYLIERTHGKEEKKEEKKEEGK
jgi:small subunit ribosomal protein S24e